MKIAAFQPTFLSYPGFYALIDSVDKFIIMDNIQFAARGWQQRVLIKINNQPKFITIPVIKKNLRNQLICETKIDTSRNFVKQHLLSIKHSYSKYPYFHLFYPKIESIYKQNFNSLIDINLAFIELICDYLNINTNKFIFLSDLQIKKNVLKDNLIYEICKIIKNTREYIATEGSRIYLQDNKDLNTEYSVKYFEYDDKKEENIYNKKKCYLSIIDLIFNYGDKTKSVMLSNFKIK